MNTVRAPSLDDVGGQVETMYTLPDLASVLRVKPRTITKYIQQGRIPPHLYSRLGGGKRGPLRFTAGQVREISTLWSGLTPPADPQRPTGMVAYRPRRTGRPSG